jgi:hypothetical protein
LLLLIALLSKDRIISANGSSFLKGKKYAIINLYLNIFLLINTFVFFSELTLRRDKRLFDLLTLFESKEAADNTFLEKLNILIEEESQSLYNDLFSDTSIELGKTLSRNEREQKTINEEKSLIYGEIDFHSFYRILRKINPKAGGNFYDLGSGTGKAVIAARFIRDFNRCIGIEILSGLHSHARKIIDRWY